MTQTMGMKSFSGTEKPKHGGQQSITVLIAALHEFGRATQRTTAMHHLKLRLNKKTISRVETFVNNCLRKILKIHWPKTMET